MEAKGARAGRRPQAAAAASRIHANPMPSTNEATLRFRDADSAPSAIRCQCRNSTGRRCSTGLGLPSLLGRLGPPVGDEGIHIAWLAVPAFPGKRLGFCDGRLEGVSGAWKSGVGAFSVSPVSGVRCRSEDRRSRVRHRQARGSKSSLLMGSCLSQRLRISTSTRCENGYGTGFRRTTRASYSPGDSASAIIRSCAK